MSESQGRPALAPAGKRTVVDEGSELEGSLKATGPIVVVGKVTGDVTGPALEVAESGAVSGTIKVGELRSRGELAGTVDAEHVELSGAVRDGAVIRARSLAVTLGRRKGEMEAVFGDCELSVGDQPDREQAVREALGKAPAEAGTKPEAAAKPEAGAKAEKAAKPERGAKGEKTEKTEKTERAEKTEKAGAGAKVGAGAKAEAGAAKPDARPEPTKTPPDHTMESPALTDVIADGAEV